MKQLCLILLLLVLPVSLVAQTAQDDRGYLTRLIEDNLSGADRNVTITGFEGALSSEARIAQMTIADAEGIWLTLEDLVLQWNRASLLRGAISVQQLRAGRVILSRAPLGGDTGPSPEAQPFALPDLPVSLSIDVLDIARIEIAEVFLGEPVVASLQGSAQLAGGEGSADILATRLEGKQGAFQIAGSYSNETDILSLLLDLNEGPDGIAARLLDLPGRPSVALTVQGAGPLDDFGASLALATDGQDRLAGDFRLATQDDGRQQVRLDAGGDISALFAPEYRDFFGSDAQVRVAFNRAADGRIDIPQITLDAGRARLSGSMRIGAQGWPEVINITGGITPAAGEAVLLPLPGPRSLVDGVTLELAYDAAISDAWTLDMTINGLARPGLSIARLGLQGGGILQSGEGDLEGRVTADLTYGAQGLAFDDSAAAQALGDAVQGALALERIEGRPMDITRLSLAGAGIDLSAEAEIAGAGQGFQTEAAIALQVAGLDRFATLLGQDLGGSARFDIAADLTPLDGLFRIDLTGSTEDLRIGVAQADAVLAGNGSIAATLVRDRDGTRLQDLRVATDAAEITASATATSAGSVADVTARLRDLSVVLPELSGAASTKGRVTLSADDQIAFTLAGDAPAATYRMTGTVAPLADERQRLDIALAADVSDLSLYAGVAGRPLAGAAAVHVEGFVLDDGSRFTLDLRGDTDDLITGVTRLDPLLAGTGEIAAQIVRPADDALQISDLSVQTPAMTLRGAADVRRDGPMTADLALQIADAQLIDPALQGPLALTLDAAPTADGQTAALLQIAGPDTALRFDAVVAGRAADFVTTGALTAQVADLAAYAGLAGRPLRGSIDLSAEGRVVPDLSAFDAQVSLRSEDLAIGNPTADALLAGTGRITADIGRADGVLEVRTLEISTPQVSFVGALNSNAGFRQGRFNASLRDVGLLTDQISGPVRATGSASLDAAGNWGVDATGTGPGGLTAQVQGTVAQSGALSLAITGAAPLALVNTAIEPRRLSGTANFDLRAEGPPGLDAFSGQITFANGRLAAPTLGQALSAITGAVRLDNGTARVDLRSGVEGGGNLAITGPVGLGEGNQADLTIRLNDVVLQDPQLYRTSVAGMITLQGPLRGGARIDGQLALGQTDVQVPSSTISTLGALPEVVHLQPDRAAVTTLARAGQLPSGAQANGTGTGTRRAFPLNIVIDAPSRIFIRGRGLDAELGGRLTIGGTSAEVIPVGRFDLLRGRIDILQQRFELTEGSASLQGEFEPYIRLVASTTSATGTQVSIVIEGPASEPQVSFESVPDLPQDEILAQLIFGRDLQSISPLQAVQLAGAISTLAGGGGGAVDQLRQSLGLDDFDVTTDEQGNAALRVGRYLSENVYTDVTISSDGGTEINLNLDITDEIVAKGGVDEEGDTGIGIFFERDY